jgi:ribosomal protein L22, bacterial type
MEARAYLYDLRITPRKVKIVLNLIRNKDVASAAAILANTRKSSCEQLSKLLKSAVANAENNMHLDVSKLIVSECFVTPGRTAKRIMPRAQGRAFRVLKRSSHITLAVAEKE